MAKAKADEGRIHIEGIERRQILVRVEAATRKGKVLVFENLRLAVGDVVRVTFPDDPPAPAARRKKG